MALDRDAFETVAVTWSQPEAGVMLSMFEFYGIPAYATGRWHASINPTLIMALDGFHVRVHPECVDDALDMLAEVAEQPAAIRPYLLGQRWLYPVILVVSFLVLIPMYVIDTPPAWYVALLVLPIIVLTGIPPTRTASTFFLWKRSRAPAGD
ncbi:hypothetical protein [Sphingomonas bacterium]|uniref:hypothetical protein n=1 Tax=Sphingomonas bacterium TaxID=1895847 RepID=UPI002605F61C|nr:hypothetical protein [Sphingomonas bacterium]MDB5679297.1 hypothetical protein [Sphingomonas bacterium]